MGFAVGAYLPLSTTLPIFIGGAVRGFVDLKKIKKEGVPEDDDPRSARRSCRCLATAESDNITTKL